jgi:hypothetical protein
MVGRPGVMGGRHVMDHMMCHRVVGRRDVMRRDRLVGRADAAGEHHPILEFRSGRGDRRGELMLTAAGDRIVLRSQDPRECAHHGWASCVLRGFASLKAPGRPFVRADGLLFHSQGRTY